MSERGSEWEWKVESDSRVTETMLSNAAPKATGDCLRDMVGSTYTLGPTGFFNLYSLYPLWQVVTNKTVAQRQAVQ